MRQIKKGSVDRSVDLYIIDATTGVPTTGLVYNSSGIDLKYRRNLEAVVSITEVTLAALTTAHADGGFLEIGNGMYRLDLPDAAWATSADHVTIFGTITGYIVLPVTVQLVDFDPEDTVRLGLTALPAAAAEAAGGLYTRGTGAGQINQAANGMIDTNPVRLNNVSQSLLDLKDFADDGYDPSTNKVQGVVLVDTTTALTAPTAATIAAAVWDLDATTHQTQGTFGQAIGDPAADAHTIYGAVVTDAAGVNVAADIIAVKAETASIQTDTNTLETAVADLPTNSELATALGTADDATLAAIAALNDLSATEVEDAVWDAAIASHLDVGSTGAALSAAGSAGDPWLTPIPGAYIAGQAGYIVGTELPALTSELAKVPKSDGSVIFNATCVGNIKSGLSTQAELDKVPKSDGTTTWNATALGSIQSEATDALNAYDGPTNAELATALGTADDAVLAAIADLPTNAELATALGTADDAVLAQIALVKAKTDNLPSDPADESLIIAATDALAILIGDVPTNAELATALGTADDAVLAAVADLPTNAELATALGTADDAVLAAIAALENISVADIHNMAVDGSVTLAQSQQLQNSAAAAKLNGAATTTVNVRDLADTKNRIVATVDADGNRSAVTRNLD